MRGHCVRGTTCKFSHAIEPRKTNSPFHGPICEFYKQGRCRFGDQCQFYHPPSVVQVISVPHPPPQDIDPPRRILSVLSPTLPSHTSGPCKFYNQGRCTKGNACPFNHATPSKFQLRKNYMGSIDGTGEIYTFIYDGPIAYCDIIWDTATETTATTNTTSTNAGMALGPCRFFARGKCARGDTCLFSHQKDNEARIHDVLPEDSTNSQLEKRDTKRESYIVAHATHTDQSAPVVVPASSEVPVSLSWHSDGCSESLPSTRSVTAILHKKIAKNPCQSLAQSSDVRLHMALERPFARLLLHSNLSLFSCTAYQFQPHKPS